MRTSIIILSIISLLTFNIHAQKSVKLDLNTSLEKTLNPGESHNYTLKLKGNQFVMLTFNQDGVDIIITAYGPDDESLGVFDSPNGRSGQEIVTLVSEKQGTYKFEVKPFDENEPSGNYHLIVNRIESAATTNEGKVDQLFVAWDRDDVPGASIAVVKDGRIIYSKGYGSANLEYNISNQPNTVFHIASDSKQFTAFAIAMLADKDKLSLDDDIRKFLPEIPDFGYVITIRDLVHHISGMRDQWNLLALAGWRLDDVITKDHIMKLVSKQQDLNFVPGNEFLYCNTGYTLLAEIVARVSGQPFELWTNENIFKPLGMDRTLFYHDHRKIVKNRAYSYSEALGGYRKSVLSYANVGATSLFTTAEDLALWALNFETMKVGNQEVMDQMHQRGVLNGGDTISYAFGQGIGNYKGLKRVSHSGGDAGYRTVLIRFPEQNFTVVVLSNNGSFNPSRIGIKIADIYLEDLLEDEPQETEEVENGKDSTPVIIVDSETLKSYVGKYEISPGLVLSVKYEEEQLTVQATGRPNIILEPQSEVKFSLTGTNGVITFQKNDEGMVDRLLLRQGELDTPAKKLPPFDPAKVNLSEFEGSYYSHELTTTYTFKIKDNMLVAEHQRHPDITFTPIDTNTFSGNAWYFRNVEFVRDLNKKIISLKVSSGRVRNAKFWKM